ncbi:CyP450 monooxygenase [Cristinia sonorae]|uniref:CyP450 monooxygenase n=1 Tax=Cristinia sonorae TaxID=1940300 RepID=A0A8K0UPY4_9AGAR|nr:CyP450 monooxygenase [Cristinia sonorae]
MLSVALVLFIFFIAVLRLRRSRPSLLLPPGPKPWPIIGNALDMPTVRPWEKYREWCKKYNSDIIFLQLPMQPAIVLGSAKAVSDLLDKRSNLYSDRITSVVAEMMYWDFNVATMPYTDRWRAHRRVFHQHFHRGIVDKYQPVQLQQVRALLSWILEDPVNTRKHVRQFVTSVIFFVTYGKRIASMDDEYVTLAEIATDGVSQALIPGAWWIEFLPFLKHVPSWVPGTTSKKLAEKYRPHVINMINKPYEEVKVALSRGLAQPSWAATLIEENEKKYQGTEEEAKYEEIARNVTGIAYAAGADTTTSGCLTFLLAMALFPKVQKRAQAELDRVVGPTRLPQYADFGQMPYIRAIVMETLRWLPVGPFGVPHMVISDDSYNGFHIPKGSLIIPDVWSILHNEEDYPDPDEFKPERFLDEQGNIDPKVRDPATIIFGFGRRVCLGRYFSNNTLSILIASILHVFDITAGVDATGQTVELSTVMEGGAILMPKDVPCGLKPRSATAAQMILAARMV